MSKKIGKYTYFLSDKKNKKLSVIVDGKKIYFGDTNYQNFNDSTNLLNKSFLHYDNERKRRYLLRAMSIRDKNNNLTYLNPLSPNYHSIRILWT